VWENAYLTLVSGIKKKQGIYYWSALYQCPLRCLVLLTAIKFFNGIDEPAGSVNFIPQLNKGVAEMLAGAG
jgi:hypothetical protein